MSPYDELTELRSVMTVQEIAEVTGIRRETLFRARADARFQRRTQKAIDDLYAVVARLRPRMAADTVHLAAVMRRPQAAFDRHSIAELLREGRVDDVLEHLDPPAPSEEERLENLEFDPRVLEQLASASDDEDHHGRAAAAEGEMRVAAMLAKDPELAAALPPIEGAILDLFGDDVRFVRAVVIDHEDPEARDHLYLRIRSALSFDEEIDRLAELFEREEDRLAPVGDRLTIGNL